MYGIDTCNMKLQYSLMIDSIIPIAKFIDHRIAILGKTKTKRTKIIDTKNKKMKLLETEFERPGNEEGRRTSEL
jgi:hypothetical protein